MNLIILGTQAYNSQKKGQINGKLFDLARRGKGVAFTSHSGELNESQQALSSVHPRVGGEHDNLQPTTVHPRVCGEHTIISV